MLKKQPRKLSLTSRVKAAISSKRVTKSAAKRQAVIKGAVKKRSAAKGSTTKKTVNKNINKIKIVINKGSRKRRKATFKRPVKKFCACKTSTCGCKSAFGATALSAQPVTPFLSQVQYNLESFDLKNEYNTATSTFRPKKTGIYTLIASVGFVANENVENFFSLFIRVNGINRIGDSEDSLLVGSGTIATSGIIRLNAGDEVQVFFGSFIAGRIVPDFDTRFEAARVG
ncbi:hypothetical protein [Paenibacillus sp. NEAU-GSW1]|uniref:hypothetical protein n=1 Tax=Paenibacillus sp. NEAU-GSW1 TaxID=2682486 RepID=UPI0015650F46|nr:hypothetical protein [Paenibacillus sp. NEAU-GSW1]